MILTASAYSAISLCMRGRIYSDHKCPLCGSTFEPHSKRSGLFCPSHPEQQATHSFRVSFGRKILKRFHDYLSAERFLNGLRYEVDRGTFDPREYQAKNPLSFTSLSNDWLEKKRLRVRPGTYNLLRNYIHVAQAFFVDRNVKDIQYSLLEDFIDSLEVSNKTKSNYLSCLHDFYKWLLKRKEINRYQFPEFPTVSFELGYRQTIDKGTQGAILDKIKEISWHVSPKIWIAVKFLSTYISIRPNELRNIKEGDIDLKQGLIFIPHPKEKRLKVVPLVEEDIQLLKSFPRGLPDLYFFRHSPGVSGVAPGARFGMKLLYKWWKRACDKLGVEGVDLYGGTRHSSAMAMRKHATPEQIRRATMHTTNCEGS